MSLVTRIEFWESEKLRIGDITEEDLERFARPVQDNDDDGTSSSSAPSEKLHLRTWADDTVQTNAASPYHPTTRENPTIGFEKLLCSCQKARVDFDCCYVWSDTCCINKEGSVEMDEAIRSMYRWYSIANVCIVHLAKSTTTSDVESDPWFRRGWTLQELLAPRVIKFYNKDWKPLFQETKM